MNAITLERPTVRVAPELPPVERVRYCLYARKSSEAEERQARSIESQLQEMMNMAKREGLEIVDVKTESHSAKEAGGRPVFNEIVEGIKAGIYNGLIAWDISRIGRNGGDIGKIVDLMDGGFLADIRTHGQRFSNSPNEKFLLMILGSQAKLENDNRGVNVKRGLKKRAELGHRPCQPPIGYIPERTFDRNGRTVHIDPERAPVIQELFRKVGEEGMTGRGVYMWLKEQQNFKTSGGKILCLSGIYRILKSTYYYGEYEFPSKSGQWHKGNYEALITKELFDKVQEKLKSPPRPKGNKDFAFVQMIKCGRCGYGITAEEKTKKFKNGSSRKYVYYHCTQSIKKICDEPYMREEELLEQLRKLMDSINIDLIGTKAKLEKEVLRYQRFEAGVLGKKIENPEALVDEQIRNYAKYMLENGSKEEKREILGLLDSRLILKNKTISLNEIH